MTTPTFDPNRPLPDMPDPWAGTSVPAARSGPPYAMTEMIAAEPALAERMLAALGRQGGGASTLAGAIRDAAVAREPIVVVGCGTSEHGAMGFAEIVRDAMRAARLPGPGPVATQAFEAALDPQEHGLCVGISHEGGTAATIRAMEAARDAGARVALVTVTERSPAAAIAEVVVATRELDQSWCHTIGYLAPLLAGTAVGAALRGEDPGSARIRGLLASGLAPAATSAAEAAAGVLAGAEHIIVVGSGADRIAGRELTLKIEEAAWIPTAYRDLETFLHGHLPATGESTGLLLLLTDRSGAAQRGDRARQLLAAARAVGVRSAAIVSAPVAGRIAAELTPAGRIVVAADAGLPGPVESLFATATPLQTLTERIARARGTNPDPIRRDDPRYAAASAAAES